MLTISQSQNSSTALHVGDGRLEDDSGDSRRRALKFGTTVVDGSRTELDRPTANSVAATMNDVTVVMVMVV